MFAGVRTALLSGVVKVVKEEILTFSKECCKTYLHYLHRCNRVFIFASQMIHLDYLNDTFIHHRQYVCESQFSDSQISSNSR